MFKSGKSLKCRSHAELVSASQFYQDALTAETLNLVQGDIQ